MQKTVFQKMTPSLPVFFLAIAQPKIKILLFKFCMRVVCMHLDTIYSIFYILEILNFIGNYFRKNRVFEFCGLNSEKYQNSEKTILQSVQFYAVWLFLIAFYFKTNSLAAFKHLPFFDRRNMTSLKRHFQNQNSMNFSKILVADVKVMLGKELKVLRRHLPPIFELSGKSGRGQNMPPPTGARVNPRLTGGGGYFLLPLVFPRYLPKLQTDHHQICNTLETINLAHPERKKLDICDTSTTNDVRVTSCFPSFR